MRYRAFISYSHADADWARWLISRLETYRVPSRLVGTQGEHGPIGARLGAFFRDREELTAAGDLGATIRAALAQSEALVLVCSPAAARSRWVEAEVEWKNRKVPAIIQLAEAQALLAKTSRAPADTDAACDLAALRTRQDPANNDWRACLGNCRWWQGQFAWPEQPELAAARAIEPTALFSAVHRTEPENERVLTWLLRAHLLQARLFLAQGANAATAQQAAMAVALIEPAWQAEQNECVRLWLAWTRLLEGDVAYVQRDVAGAHRAWSAARQFLLANSGDIPFPRLDPLVRALLALGRHAEAAPHRQRLDNAGYVPLDPFADPNPLAASAAGSPALVAPVRQE